MDSFTTPISHSTPIYCYQQLEDVPLNEQQRQYLGRSGYDGKAGSFVILPAEHGGVVVLARPLAETPWQLASLAEKLPDGVYHLAGDVPVHQLDSYCLGWALAQYRYGQFRQPTRESCPQLVWPDSVNRAEILALVKAINLVRRLVNMPANYLGPVELAKEAEIIAARYGAEINIIDNQELLTKEWPMVRAVGQASPRLPCVIDLRWGKKEHPLISLVGKGVIFDTGGLDIKTAGFMELMKKDMGGAAHALALAELVMSMNLPVRLRVIIPAVENAVAGNAFRPGDIFPTRKGLTVEIGNTDAEGRLILADALTAACEDKPALILDFATLTGAARGALGLDIPAFFCNHEQLATRLEKARDHTNDPFWRLPLWQGYRSDLECYAADLRNIASHSYAGAIIAALFLQRFVDDNTPWAHFDLFAWNNKNRAGRPEGGEAYTIRACYEFLKQKNYEGL